MPHGRLISVVLASIFIPALLSLAGTMWLPSALQSQESGPHLLDQRVRLTLQGRDEAFSGRLLGVGSDSLTLGVGPGIPARIAREDVVLLERSLGHQNRVGRGLMVGALSGLAVGGIIGLIFNEALSTDAPWLIESDPGGAFLRGGAAFGAMGAGIGILVGWSRSGEVWEPVDLEDSPWRGALHVRASPTGVKVGVRLALPRGGVW